MSRRGAGGWSARHPNQHCQLLASAAAVTELSPTLKLPELPNAAEAASAAKTWVTASYCDQDVRNNESLRWRLSQHRGRGGFEERVAPHKSATGSPTHRSFIFSACFLNFSANSISADLT
jgi:hypothetical protein